tara:strand:+ start:2717 stop:2947 length:231 start_codon:yes stop_codon:yes gene_type:complete
MEKAIKLTGVTLEVPLEAKKQTVKDQTVKDLIAEYSAKIEAVRFRRTFAADEKEVAALDRRLGLYYKTVIDLKSQY